MQKLYAPLCAHANAQCEFTTISVGQTDFSAALCRKTALFLWYRIVQKRVHTMVYTVFDGVYTAQHAEYQ